MYDWCFYTSHNTVSITGIFLLTSQSFKEFSTFVSFSELCPPLVSLNVYIRCFNGDKDIDCSKPMRLGTRAKGECKPFSTQIRPLPYTDIFCTNDGQWSGELLECLPGKTLSLEVS